MTCIDPRCGVAEEIVVATRFITRTVRHKNGNETLKPVYVQSDKTRATLWVAQQRRIAEQRGFTAAAKGLRTLGHPLSIAVAVLLGTEEQAVSEVLRERCF